MKIWIKYLIGIALGIAAYAILPLQEGDVSSVLQFIAEISIRFGRFALIPLLFFGIANAVYKLRVTARFFKHAGLTFALIAFFSLVLAALGILSAILIKLPRLPITGERIAEIQNIDIKTLIVSLFPYSAFDALSEGGYLLPVFVLAAFVGGGCVSEKENARPVIAFVEAATRVFHNIASFFVDWISLCLIALTAWWIFSTKSAIVSSVYSKMFLVLGIDFLIFAILLCPLFIFLICRDPRPFHVLYASIAPVLTAFISADTNFSLLVNIRHGRESLGIRDEVNSVSFPLFASFCRGGTALVVSVCFVSIIRSYVDMGIRVEDVIWLFGTSFALSFILCAIPQGGTFIALSIVCTMYGRGFADGFVLLRPAVPFLCSIAAAFDATSAIYGSYITAVKMRAIDHNSIKKYI